MNEQDAEVVDRLESAGISVGSFKRVSVTNKGEEIVYQVTTSSGSLFVRTVEQFREDGIREVIESGVDIGMPDSRLVDGDPALLVMEQASGRPLSLLLPIYLAPGIWSAVASGLESGFEALGRYHGRLHAETARGTARLYKRYPYDEELKLPETAKQQLGERYEILVPWAERAREVEATQGLIHSDPTPHNIYYEDGDVDLIDVDLMLASVLKDRLAVEYGVELMVRRLPYGRKSQENRLLDAYYRGYGTEGPSEDIPHWTYLTLKASHYCWMIDRYETITAKAMRDRITALTDGRVIVDRITELADSLEGYGEPAEC